MSFIPPTPVRTRRAADDCRWEVVRRGGQWSMRVTVQTTGNPITVELTQSEIVAATTGAERTNTQSLFDKCQTAALTKAGWTDDGQSEAP